MKSVTLKFSIEEYLKVKEHYSPFQIDEKGDYLDFSAKKDDVIIKGYSSNKTKRSIVFIGENSILEARLWQDLDEKSIIQKEKLQIVDYGEQIGSDEVGVGDFYLPIIVVASYIDSHQYIRLKELGVTDSKKMSDKKIKDLGPVLIREFDFSKLTCSNEKYNEMISKGYNINSIKAKMHNRALNNLHHKYIDVIAIYVDQFVAKDKYYSYLEKDDEPILKDISFKTKGESRFPSVALASVIARYYLLLEKEKIEQKYQLKFPFGAGNKVDEFKKILIEKVGFEEYKKIVKKNFKNYLTD